VSSFEVFPYFWLGLVAFGCIGWLLKGVHELRAGVARWSWWGGEQITRSDDPFHYWFTIVGDFVGAIMFAVMFWLGLDMLRW
jgi:hypothetical protein